MGYCMEVKVLCAHDYGVPETRRRTILLGSQLDKHIIFPDITHGDNQKHPLITVDQALHDLADKKNRLHNHDLTSAQLPTEIDRKRLAHIPEGKGIRYHEDEKKYFKSRNLKLGVDWANLPEGRFRQTKYFRLDGAKPSPTIMTHRHSYYHPSKLRYLTQREAARLQSFPNDFIFHGPLSAQWRQIGNAVPPLLGKAIGRTLLAMLKMKTDTKKIKKSSTSLKSSLGQARSNAFMYRPSATPTQG